MNTEVLYADVEFLKRAVARPLQLSNGSITKLTEARATVRVIVVGKEATGRASIYLSDLWAWPDASLSHAEKDAALRRFCETIAGGLDSLCGGEPAHPLELGLRLHDAMCTADHPPVLARLMCASPFDAAIHDAAGMALGHSAFQLYSEPVRIPTADRYFPKTGACRAIQRIVRKPVTVLPAWWIVGAHDSLTAEVLPIVRAGGYDCFKLKLSGKDSAADVARTVEIFRAAKALSRGRPRLSLDSNEGNPDADSVVEYLERLRRAHPEAFQAVAYLEQPTGRDIRRHAFDWRKAAPLKPVLLDEGLVGVDVLPAVLEQGGAVSPSRPARDTASHWSSRHGRRDTSFCSPCRT